MDDYSSYGYIEDYDTHDYPLCPYDGMICVIENCTNCSVNLEYDEIHVIV